MIATLKSKGVVLARLLMFQKGNSEFLISFYSNSSFTWPSKDYACGGFPLDFTELNGRGLSSLMLRETGPEPPIFMSQLGHGFAPRLVCFSVLLCLSREGVRPGTEAAAKLIRDIRVTSFIPAADGCSRIHQALPDEALPRLFLLLHHSGHFQQQELGRNYGGGVMHLKCMRYHK